MPSVFLLVLAALVLPQTSSAQVRTSELLGTRLIPKMYEMRNTEHATRGLRALVKNIRADVEPGSWKRRGVSVDVAGTTLIVTQTAPVHQVLDQYLRWPRAAWLRLRAQLKKRYEVSRRVGELRRKMSLMVSDAATTKADIGVVLRQLNELVSDIYRIEARIADLEVERSLRTVFVPPGSFAREAIELAEVVETLNATRGAPAVLIHEGSRKRLARERVLLPSSRRIRLERVLEELVKQTDGRVRYRVQGGAVVVSAAGAVSTERVRKR